MTSPGRKTITTTGACMPGIGNAWHIPANRQPTGQSSMRFPLQDIEEDTVVTVANGNQFRGSGIAGNQNLSGSALMIKRMGNLNWEALEMQFHSASGNDKFFFSRIPARRFQSGDVIQYYFRIGYTDRNTTFLHGSDHKCFATDDEQKAQSDPFTFAILHSLKAEGSFVSFSSGIYQGRVSENSGHIQMAGPNLQGEAAKNVVTLAPPIVVIQDRSFCVGRVISSNELENGLEVVQQTGPHQTRAKLTFPFDGVMRYEVVDWEGHAPSSVKISSASNNEEHFYGLGEKFNSLDQTGKIIDILTFDNPGEKGDRSYKVAPWFVSTSGYGFHLDSDGRSTFDLRTKSRQRYEITSQTRNLRFEVVFGPQLTEVIRRYSGITGRPRLAPPWAFGAWISSDIWRTGGEVRYAVTKFRERQIPVSAFVFDSPWEVAYNDFQFNEAQFATAATFENQSFAGFNSVTEMMRFLQQNGLKVICWMTPFINVKSIDEGVPGQNLEKSENYDDGAARQLYVRASEGGEPLIVNWWKGIGSPVDFTKSEARTWLSEQLVALLKTSEVDTIAGKEPAIGGFKTDDGEFGNGTDTYIPDTAVYSNGLTGRDFVNGYCREYHKTVFDVLGSKGLIFARSGFTGTQAFPGCWAGDNQPNFGIDNGLPSVIVAGLSAAMCGYSTWGHDIGGYENGPFSPVSPADLFIRWTQFGCFSPIMQMHRQVNPADLRHYPWGYIRGGESLEQNEALENYIYYATLHTRLFPYIYTHSKEAEQAGLPIMRPLVMLHQDDVRTFGIEHTYYFGTDLIVAPIIEPKSTERRVYLPKGTWFDFWTNRRYEGAREISWKSPTTPAEPKSKLPVFVRGGAIIPLILQGDVQSLCDKNYVNNPELKTWDDGGIEVSIYPQGRSESTLFDGSTITCTEGIGPTPTTITVASPIPRPVVLRVNAPRPGKVTRNGTALTKTSSLTAFLAASEAWRFDSASKFIFVKYSQPASFVTIAL
jgi:alpha-D-xyloside xylohydrolase